MLRENHINREINSRISQFSYIDVVNTRTTRRSEERRVVLVLPLPELRADRKSVVLV